MRTVGRHAVITGASSGIGAAIAHRLAGQNCALLLVGRDQQRLERVAAATGGQVLVADLATRAGIEDVIAAADGWVDLLVHSAGIGAAAPVADTPADVVDELLTVDLAAPIQLTAALLPTLEQAAGHVVFLASIAAVGVADEALYSAAKAGLRGFADALRIESTVGVTTVLPGAVATPYYATRGRPYHRGRPSPVTPERVAEAALRAIHRDRAEVFVPRWLAVAARVHGVAPGLFARLSRTFDRRS